MMDDKRWIGKKIYLETFSNRRYSGIVIDETLTKLIIKDIKQKIVELSKVDIKLCQEESQ